MDDHKWSTPRWKTKSLKLCLRCDITYAEFLGTHAGCKNVPIKPPKPIAAAAEKKRLRPPDDYDDPIGTGKQTIFMKPKLLHLPQKRRGCQGLYCETRAEHIHSGTKIVYI